MGDWPLSLLCKYPLLHLSLLPPSSPIPFLLPTSKTTEELAGKRVVLFSYGSGLASAMYSIQITTDSSPKSPLVTMATSCTDIVTRLQSRKTVSPSEFEKTMKLREETHHKAPYQPVGPLSDLAPGTYYLTAVDDKHRRSYARVETGGTKEPFSLKSPAREQGEINGTI